MNGIDWFLLAAETGVPGLSQINDSLRTESAQSLYTCRVFSEALKRRSIMRAFGVTKKDDTLSLCQGLQHGDDRMWNFFNGIGNLAVGFGGVFWLTAEDEQNGLSLRST